MKKLAVLLFILAILISILARPNQKTNTPSFQLFDNAIWTKEINNNERIISQPVYFDDKLIVQTSSELNVFDMFSGNLIWEAASSSFQPAVINFDYLPVKLNRSLLILQTEENTISAFNMQNGNILWASNEVPIVSSFYSENNVSIYDLEFLDDLVFVSRWNNTIAAYNITNGELVWSKPVPTRTILDIMLYDDKLLLGTLDNIYFFDKGKGDEKGLFTLTGDSQGYLIDEEILYIAFDNGKCSVAALDLVSLTYKWCVSPLRFYYFSHPVSFVSNTDSVYMYYQDNIVAISKEDGAIHWSIDSSDYIDRLYIEDSYLYAVNKDAIIKINVFEGVEEKALTMENLYLRWLPILSQELIYTFGENKISVYKNPFH